MKITSVSYSISYISYVVEYINKPSKYVRITAFTESCVNRIMLFREYYELDMIFRNIPIRYRHKIYRDWLDKDIPILKQQDIIRDLTRSKQNEIL